MKGHNRETKANEFQNNILSIKPTHAHSDSPHDPRMQHQAPVWNSQGLTFGWGKWRAEQKEKKRRWWARYVRLSVYHHNPHAALVNAHLNSIQCSLFYQHSTTGGDRQREVRLRFTVLDEKSSGSNSSTCSTSTNDNPPTSNDDEQEIPIPLPAESPFWRRVRRGKEVFLHVFLVRTGGLHVQEEENGARVVSLEGHDGSTPLHGVVPLVKRQVCVCLLLLLVCMCGLVVASTC